MNYGVLMLSKVIEQNDPNALLRFNITAEDLPTEGERKALRYITEYAEKHGGQAPTAEMVAMRCRTSSRILISRPITITLRKNYGNRLRCESSSILRKRSFRNGLAKRKIIRKNYFHG